MSFGGLNADQLTRLVDEREEMIARSETLYDAMTECRGIARTALMPDHDQDEALTRIVALVDRTRHHLDDLLNAAQKSGSHYDRLDAEAMQWYDAVERQFHLLTPEGKRRVVAARKRADRNEHRDGTTEASASETAQRLAGEGRGRVRSLTLHTAD